jgi:hypothetical protein
MGRNKLGSSKGSRLLQKRKGKTDPTCGVPLSSDEGGKAVLGQDVIYN